MKSKIRSKSQQNLFTDTSKVITDVYDASSDIVFALGDSQEILSRCPEGFASLIITSPPYNIGKEYESQVRLEQYLKQLDPILKEIVRVLSPQGSLCWQVGNYVDQSEVFPLDIYKFFARKLQSFSLEMNGDIM